MPGRRAATLIDTEALKRERPLADVVATYGVALRREGAGRSVPCARSTPSTRRASGSTPATAADEHYYCFGCSAHGDVLKFVMARENCAFRPACERLARRGRPSVRHDPGAAQGSPPAAAGRTSRPTRAKVGCCPWLPGLRGQPGSQHERSSLPAAAGSPG